MTGPWEKYQKSAPAADGPWAKYTKSSNAAPADKPAAGDEPGAGLSTLDAVGNGLTLGYLPQLQAAAAPYITKGLNAVTGQDVPVDDYLTERDSNIARMAAEKKAYPKTTLAGNLGGGVLGTLATAGMAPELAGVSGLAKAAGAGAVYGAAANPGDTPGEYSGVQAADRLKGGATGAVTGAVLHGLLSGADAAPEVLQSGARNMAIKSVGGTKGQIQKLLAQSGEGDFANRADEVGQTLLDKVISPFASNKTMAARLDAEMASQGNQLGSHIEQLEALQNPASKLTEEQRMLLQNAKLDPKAAAEATKAAIVSANPGAPTEELQPAMSKIDTWLKPEEGPLGPEAAQAKKVTLGKFLNDRDYMQTVGMGKEGLKAVRDSLKTNLENQSDLAASIAPDAIAPAEGSIGPAYKGPLEDINRAYANAKLAGEMADKGVAKHLTNNVFSLGDTLTGTGEIANKGLIEGLTGIPGMLLHKAGRMYGNQMSAVALNNASAIAAKLQVPVETVLANPALLGGAPAATPWTKMLNKGDSK